MIKIYSTPSCPYCHQAKDFLKEHNIEFEDVNVAEDEKARDEMIEKSGQMGVPVIDIDGEIIVGFDKAKLSELLKIKWSYYSNNSRIRLEYPLEYLLEYTNIRD